jgi:hypothetical protein
LVVSSLGQAVIASNFRSHVHMQIVLLFAEVWVRVCG